MTLGSIEKRSDRRLGVYTDLLEELFSPYSVPDQAGKLIGSGKEMRSLIHHLKRYAPTSHNVLILGETGSGKELCAEAIHQLSKFRRQKWVAVNCAAIPSSLITAELFGAEEGAFTNAQKRKGLILSAHRGTLFLDEIGELSLEAQAALLRTLELGEVRPVGSDRVYKISFRLICATHHDLPTRVKEGLFRADLYHRIATFTLRVPPLRDRTEDLPLLVSQLSPKCAMRFTHNAWCHLKSHRWPGNVRELKNILSRLEVERPRGEIRSIDLYLPHSMAELSPPSHMPDGDEGILTPHEDKYLISGPPKSDGSPPSPPSPPPSPSSPPPPTPHPTVEAVTPDDSPFMHHHGLKSYRALEGIYHRADLHLLFTMMPALTLEDLNRLYVINVMQRASGNISEAARTLGVSRGFIYRKLALLFPDARRDHLSTLASHSAA